MSLSTDKAALNFPDLRICILRQDKSGVLEILKKDTSSIRSTNCFGQTSVHIVVGAANLEILQIILLHADALLLNKVDCTEPRGYRPIEYSVQSKLHEQCCTSASLECNGCNVLEALLSSGCAMLPSFLSTVFSRRTRDNGGTAMHLQKRVILRLGERRRRLAECAMKHFSPAKNKQLGLYLPKILNEAAGHVQTALNEHSISIPISLKVYDCDSDNGEDWNFRPLHSYIANEQGFRDLGLDSAFGFDELWNCVLNGFVIQDAWHRSQLVYHVLWLVDGGAQLGKPLSRIKLGEINHALWTPAHLLSAYLCHALAEDGDFGFQLPDLIKKAITSIDIVDQCRCACSLNGCSSLIILLDGVVSWERASRNKEPSALHDYKQNFRWFCELWTWAVGGRGQAAAQTQMVKSISRYLTFTVLDLRHSCCRLGQYSEIHERDDEDATEIVEEQREELVYLEELLRELEQDYANCPDVGTFIDDHWERRMQVAVDDLNSRKLDEADLRAAENIGVIWQGCGVEKPNENLKDNIKFCKLDHWMEWLNKIVPEPDVYIPLPRGVPGPEI